MISLLIKLLIVILICIVLFFMRKKLNVHLSLNKFVAIVLMFLCLVFLFCPWEDVFITFDSPESAFKYSDYGDIVYMFSGENSEFILSEKSGYSVSIVPKTENGWKMAKRAKVISNKSYKTNLILIYFCKQTDDYYIMISSLSTKPESVYDNCNSDFCYFTRTGSALGRNYYTYYAFANIKNYDEQYTLNIGDGVIKFGE